MQEWPRGGTELLCQELPGLGGLELNPDAPPYVCWAVGAPCSSFSGLLEGVCAVVSAGREAELYAEVFKLLGLIFPSWATETWEGRGVLRAGATSPVVPPPPLSDSRKNI